MELHQTSIDQLRKLLDTKQISAVELCETFLDRIEKNDPKLNSFITVCRDEAISAANDAQKKINAGQAGHLTGIPVSLKDNICSKDVRTSCASKILHDFIPPYDATVVSLLKDSGAVLIGKTNMDEFGMGGSSQNTCFHGVKNPLDTSRVPGGSSGGAAAGIAAGFAAAALGSDTGGSVRQPASFCGVTGIKPTYGAVSRYGLIAFASSLDQIGVISKSAKDCGTVLNTISAYDTNDATMRHSGISNFNSKVGSSLSGLTIGIPDEFFGEGTDDEVKASVLGAAAIYEKMGLKLKRVSLPSLAYATQAYYLISSAEAASNLARYDGVKFGYRSNNGKTYDEVVCNTRAEGFGEEVKRRIMLGNYALASGYYDAYYKKATLLRKQIKAEYNDIFSSCDFILTPTAPTPAYKIGENESDPVKMYLADICTVTINIAGITAISTPCGYAANGMPIGMSLVGRAFGEETIIAAADLFESQFERREVTL